MGSQGHIEMDTVLFVVMCIATGVHVYCLRSWIRQREGIGIGLLLRLGGWLVLSARFGAMLLETGDLPVSVPSAIGLFLLAAGDIAGMLSRGNVSRETSKHLKEKS